MGLISLKTLVTLQSVNFYCVTEQWFVVTVGNAFECGRTKGTEPGTLVSLSSLFFRGQFCGLFCAWRLPLNFLYTKANIDKNLSCNSLTLIYGLSNELACASFYGMFVVLN